MPTLLAQERWKLLRPRVGCGVQTDAATSQQCWDLQCIVGSIQPTRLFKPCVMRVVGRAVQTDPTLLSYASVVPEQKKCWELLAQTFDW